MKHIIFRLKYPRLVLLMFTFILAYLIFDGRNMTQFNVIITSLGYVGTFISGFLFAYGFTSAPATVLLILFSKSQNIFISGAIATLGTFIGNLLIYKFVTASLSKEITGLEKSVIKKMHENHMRLNIHGKLKRYLTLTFVGIFLASPLPNEIADTVVASSKVIHFKTFVIFSFIMSAIGVYTVILLGTVI